MIKKYIIQKIEDFEQLREKWKQLECGKDMTIFQSYDWIVLVFQQYINERYNRIFSFVVVYESNNVIVPVIIQKHGLSFKWLGRSKGIYFLGEGSYSDYMNLVYDEAKDGELKDIINYIINDNKGLPWKFSFVRDGTRLNQILSKNNIPIIHQMVSVEVYLPESVEGYDKSLSKSTKQNLRTALNRMKRDKINYKLIVTRGRVNTKLADELVPIHLNRVLDINTGSTEFINRISNWLKRRRLVRTETTNNIINNSMKSLSNSLLVISMLNDSIAGYLYGLADNQKIRILQNCFVDEYKFYSPMFRGAYDFLVREIEEHNIKCVDFTRGNEEYKYRLGGSEIKLLTYRLENVL